tara:strand:+ start:275 stop:436 length:162 start_codon:yes stop_codon:yes gene_type:complete
MVILKRKNNMATDLRCPNCEDNLGKDRENHVHAYCGNCGEEFYNDEGYTDEDE